MNNIDDTSPLLINSQITQNEINGSYESIIQVSDISCRICKEPITIDEYKKVCSCTGYIKFIHTYCLNTWVNTSK